MSKSQKWSPKHSEDLYNVRGWGQGYFGVNGKGHLCAYPGKDPR